LTVFFTKAMPPSRIKSKDCATALATGAGSPAQQTLDGGLCRHIDALDRLAESLRQNAHLLGHAEQFAARHPKSSGEGVGSVSNGHA